MSFLVSSTIADVTRLIIGADHLERYGLIVDIENRRLIDRLTFVKSKGDAVSAPFIELKTISGDSAYHNIPCPGKSQL